jgi:hypothetical protein
MQHLGKLLGCVRRLLRSSKAAEKQQNQTYVGNILHGHCPSFVFSELRVLSDSRALAFDAKFAKNAK